MAFHIKNSETDALARKVAALKKLSLTEAVHTALLHELEREQGKPSLVELGIQFTRDLRAKGQPAVGDGFKQIEQQATSEDERRERERKAAAAAAAAAAQRASIQRANANRENANRAGSRGSGPGYGATIRSIDVDGQRFNLDGGGNNSGGAPASGGGQ